MAVPLALQDLHISVYVCNLDWFRFNAPGCGLTGSAFAKREVTE